MTKGKQVWRDVVNATYPPGPYRDGRSIWNRRYKQVEVSLLLDGCSHSKIIMRRVGVKVIDSSLRALPDEYVVEAPPQRVRCKICEEQRAKDS